MGTFGTGPFDSDAAGDAVSFLTYGKRLAIRGHRVTLKGNALLLHTLTQAATDPSVLGEYGHESQEVFAYAVLVAALVDERNVVLLSPSVLDDDTGKMKEWFDETSKTLATSNVMVQHYAFTAALAVRQSIAQHDKRAADWNTKALADRWRRNMVATEQWLLEWYDRRLLEWGPSRSLFSKVPSSTDQERLKIERPTNLFAKLSKLQKAKNSTRPVRASKAPLPVSPPRATGKKLARGKALARHARTGEEVSTKPAKTKGSKATKTSSKSRYRPPSPKGRTVSD